MRVLFLDLSVRYGGASSRCLNLLSYVSKNEFALAGLQNSAVMKEAAKRGIEYYELGSSKFSPLILVKLWAILKSGDFDIIDVQNPQAKVWGIFVSLWFDIPLLSTLHSWYSNEHCGSFKGKLYQAFELITTPVTTSYIAVSKDI